MLFTDEMDQKDTHRLCLQACLLLPPPPNLIMSLQAGHLPQSGAWQTWRNIYESRHQYRTYVQHHRNAWPLHTNQRETRKGSLTSQTPQRCLFAPALSLSFCSICSEKKVSKIWYTSVVVVALVGPLLSFSIFVGWRMACLLAALLSTEQNLCSEETGPLDLTNTWWYAERWRRQITTASGHATQQAGRTTDWRCSMQSSRETRLANGALIKHQSAWNTPTQRYAWWFVKTFSRFHWNECKKQKQTLNCITPN